ncbi:MAG: hypothetical protein M5U26_27435 [Planctomycetota bacterium]|nr:hypothetical protein [Planctomycetota bacterium]
MPELGKVLFLVVVTGAIVLIAYGLYEGSNLIIALGLVYLFRSIYRLGTRRDLSKEHDTSRVKSISPKFHLSTLLACVCASAFFLGVGVWYWKKITFQENVADILVVIIPGVSIVILLGVYLEKRVTALHRPSDPPVGDVAAQATVKDEKESKA